MLLPFCAHTRRRCALQIALAICATLMLGQRARADAIPGVSTLQDLIDRGPNQSGGVQTGSDLFYHFTYSLAPAGGAPTPSQILVTFTDAGPGLRFASNLWTSSGGNDISSVIGYSVHVVDTIPQQAINTAILDFQSTVNPAHPTGPEGPPDPADNASVTESLGDNNGHVPFTQLTAFNANGTVTGGPPDTTSQTIAPPLRDFGVSNGVVVHTSAGSTGNATITYFDNIFGNTTVPEPAALSLLTLGAVPLLARRRR